MKKSGITILSIGVVLMGVSAFKFSQGNNKWSAEQTQEEKLTFPWIPIAGSILTAAGIIMIGDNNKKTII